ncbi:hypothetical protein GOV11_00980 [Candidatus Woesearchaeota archaeon]|nr:hypothetical protein [Candidatus Woesearchaeota archaeon]
MSYYPNMVEVSVFLACFLLIIMIAPRIDKFIERHRDWHKDRFERGVWK